MKQSKGLDVAFAAGCGAFVAWTLLYMAVPDAVWYKQLLVALLSAIAVSAVMYRPWEWWSTGREAVRHVRWKVKSWQLPKRQERHIGTIAQQHLDVLAEEVLWAVAKAVHAGWLHGTRAFVFCVKYVLLPIVTGVLFLLPVAVVMFGGFGWINLGAAVYLFVVLVFVTVVVFVVVKNLDPPVYALVHWAEVLGDKGDDWVRQYITTKYRFALFLVPIGYLIVLEGIAIIVAHFVELVFFWVMVGWNFIQRLLSRGRVMAISGAACGALYAFVQYQPVTEQTFFLPSVATVVVGMSVAYVLHRIGCYVGPIATPVEYQSEW